MNTGWARINTDQTWKQSLNLHLAVTPGGTSQGRRDAGTVCQAAPGHNSEAVHRAYARKAQIIRPPLEDCEMKVATASATEKADESWPTQPHFSRGGISVPIPEKSRPPCREMKIVPRALKKFLTNNEAYLYAHCGPLPILSDLAACVV